MQHHRESITSNNWRHGFSADGADILRAIFVSLRLSLYLAKGCYLADLAFSNPAKLFRIHIGDSQLGVRSL
jgi:hypothetical protein